MVRVETFRTVLDGFLTQTLEQSPVPGVTLAVAHEGRVIYESARGYANLERGISATPRTRFGIGSISKLITAMALSQLADAGELALTDPVVRHLPELRFPGADGITLHHLLAMTSGLPALGTETYGVLDDPGQAALPPRGSRGRTRIETAADLLAFLGEIDLQLLAPPGAVTSYSNDSWVPLGVVVERVSGLGYAEYVQAHILAPLGLSDTVFGSFGAVGAGTRGYAPDGAGSWRPRADGRVVPSMQAAGGGPQLSTVHDLLRLLEVLRQHGTVDGQRILSPAAVAQLTAGHAPTGPGWWVGYGVSVGQEADGVHRIAKGGGDLGVSAHVLLAPELGLTMAALANVGGGVPARLTEGALQAWQGRTPGETPGEAPVAVPVVADLGRFVGTYANGLGSSLGLLQADGALVMELRGSRYRATPIAPDTLAVDQDGERTVLTLAADAAGVCYGVRTGGRVWRRVES